MPTPSSGTITYYNLGTFSLGSSYNGFQTTNISMNAFTRGGYWVPNIGSPTSNQNVPGSASNMGMNSYYNVWGYRRLSFNIGVFSTYYTSNKTSYYITGYQAAIGTSQTQSPYNDYGSAFGSISANTFLTANGTMTITGMFYDQGQYGNTLLLNCNTGAPPDNDITVIGFYSSYNNTFYSRASSIPYRYAYSYTRLWGAGFGAVMFPGSGTYSCYVNYYG